MLLVVQLAAYAAGSLVSSSCRW